MEGSQTEAERVKKALFMSALDYAAAAQICDNVDAKSLPPGRGNGLSQQQRFVPRKIPLENFNTVSLIHQARQGLI